MPTGPTDFAFALPLEWPLDEEERKAYERALIDYALLMQPLIAGAQGDERRELLSALSVFVRELRQLWQSSSMPPELGQFVAMFE